VSRNFWQETWDDFTRWLGLDGIAVEVPLRGFSGLLQPCPRSGPTGRRLGGKGADHQSVSCTWTDAEKTNEA
jgi:hypothetical protein